MLSLLAIGTIVVLMMLILTNWTSPLVALITVPVVAAVAGGFGLQTTKFMVAGITAVAPVTAMFVFSILFFAIMTDAGVMEPAVQRLLRLIGQRPARVAVGSAALALLVHLDGSGAVCFLVVIPALLPLYTTLGMDKRVLACVTSMAAGVNFLPWTGPTIRAAAALHVPVMEIFRPLLIVQLIGLIYVFLVAYLLGRREARRLQHSLLQHRDVVVVAPPPDATWRLSLRFVLNALLVLVVLGALVSGLIEPAAGFMMGTAVALIVNYPRSKQQQARVEAHAKTALVMASTLMAAGVFSGVMGGTGMLQALAHTVVSNLPSGAGRHLPAVLGLISMPLSLIFDPDSFYFGVMPVLAEVTRHAGGQVVSVAQASLLGVMTTGFPVSPLTPATFLVTGMTGIELAAHQKFTGPFLFAASVLMTIAALVIGVFPL
jgi:CitMHS family citrate-Mg2+:H+ or citrate-Ca2+:H+ symporter